jgi:hypothetical protein
MKTFIINEELIGMLVNVLTSGVYPNYQVGQINFFVNELQTLKENDFKECKCEEEKGGKKEESKL